MPMIVDCKTKKELTQLLSSQAAGALTFEDPAAMPNWRQFGRQYFTIPQIPDEAIFTCTNPKRSWVARVTKRGSAVTVE